MTYIRFKVKASRRLQKSFRDICPEGECMGSSTLAGRDYLYLIPSDIYEARKDALAKYGRIVKNAGN